MMLLYSSFPILIILKILSCTSYFDYFCNMIIPVVCAILSKGNQVLITQRSASMSNPLEWEFPGGKIAAGEIPQTAIVRELKEELSIIVKPLMSLGTVLHPLAAGQTLQLTAWKCEIIAGEPKLNEHIQMKWVRQNELPAYPLSVADKMLLEVISF